MRFLCYDGASITDNSYKLYEISYIAGLLRLMKPWKYYLHETMGRPIIVRTGIWGRKV